jgi:Kdo2-lipid IVA lauroyltransferase/acyltransferase
LADGRDRAPAPRLAHRVEFALARGLERAAATLPEAAADAFGRRLGRTAYRLSIRRGVVEENVRRAYPAADDAWIRATTRAAYEHLGRETAAILRLSTLDPEAVVARTVPVGWDAFEEARAEGRGVILATGHYGNWEIAAATIASRGVPIAAIVRRQGNRLVDARLDLLRSRLGVETISQREAPSRVPRLLRAGGVVGIVGDQDARAAGVFVPFFGRPASTHRGPALFAVRLRAAVFACVARRLPGPGVRYEVAGSRVALPDTGDVEADVRTLTASLAAHLEAEVRRAPEQYFWFHRRWKTPPPGEPSSSAPGTTPGDDAETPEATQGERP